MEKPSLPSGTRDFGPAMMASRNYLLQTLANTFRLFGFAQIETPALENLKTLQGKYGDEGDQLLFKILNNGDYLEKVSDELYASKNSKQIQPKIADRGLRYDLTVPMARFVVMHRNEISFPFKRFQMQPVWRADRPQKGRYREFWQCDVDVVGSNSVMHEAELIQIYQTAFAQFQLPVIIKINHRKVLDAFADNLGGEKNFLRFMQLIDKFDKIGFDGVLKEIVDENIPNGSKVWHFLAETNQLKTNKEKLEAIANCTFASDIKFLGLKDLQAVFDFVEKTENVELDLTLARGLSYYTGCVFEVVVDSTKLKTPVQMGSIGGGGRYDNLTGYFGLKDVSGVGVSFGLDRIFDVLLELNLFPNNLQNAAKVIFCMMDENAMKRGFELAGICRQNGIPTEVYPLAAKLGKQLDFANNNKIDFAVIIGANELQTEKASVKNLQSGVQASVDFKELAAYLKNN